ncbi:hypothetical protein BC939DRAFT_453637 [Gamsiella multidivaricata]|uniref:uncharacterized protein n=1 Tax=Gamsiella multidivaricata TaxID=101098 RepID=UPI00221FB84B|nr:uncharacterized protein BC939DRAFT_453637 [Gamsiella multidivaricata]KAI7822556.1 hypothetical protein BC939DRAFT_453637 [Gamsiella multidivaricata]
MNRKRTQRNLTQHGTKQPGHQSLLTKTSFGRFWTTRRRLLPKRVHKDPVMEELLYYTRSQPTSHAVFVPVIRSASANNAGQNSNQSCGDSGSSRNDRDIEEMMKVLPFYYPKVRGFRYGFTPDLTQDASENRDGDPENRDGHRHKDEDGSEEGCYEYVEDEDSAEGAKTENDGSFSGNTKITSKRAGWITLDLFLAGDEGVFTDKMQYAFKELFKKLYKWGVNATKGFTKSRVQHDVMVPKDLYLATYARLKETYAQKWVQSWPEKTDPRKFVFEDISIASWLVALWELERQQYRLEHHEDQSKDDNSQDKESKMEKQTFVDLGCGNGLLTHILNEEGHAGTGIDIVSRKVWDIYGPETHLEAKTIIPNETALDNVDWIIGNHADELAPWIPIIAMRSKPLTRFVVIPCCFFDLNGSRYQFPKGAPEGKYKAYQEYICSIVDACGYHLQTEMLRIPSTKNVALVGMTRKRKRYVGGEDAEGQQCHERVDSLVRQSGVFVARISDKDKQIMQKSKQTTKMLTRKTDA